MEIVDLSGIEHKKVLPHRQDSDVLSYLHCYPGDFQAVLQDGLHLILVRRLAVDPHDRFGAAETDQQPAAILQLELEAIDGDQFGHFQAAEGFRFRVEDHLLAALAVSAERVYQCGRRNAHQLYRRAS